MHTSIRQTRLNQVLQTLSANPGTVVIPGVKTKSPETSSSQMGDTFYLTGMAVISDWKLKGWLDGDEAMGYMWVMEQMEHHGFNVSFKTGTISLEALPNQTSIKVEVNQAGVKQITIKIKGKVRLSEWKNISIETDRDPLGTEKELSKAINQEIEKMVEQTLKNTQALNADILQLNENIRMSSPRWWEKISNEWERDIFPKIQFRVEADVSVRDIGELYRTITSQ